MKRETPLLARDAENLFWMARYLERVENLARLIDVTQTFESPGLEGDSWTGLVRINSDEGEFAARGLPISAAAVKHFYLRDRDNPTGLPASMEAVRYNARTLRPLISTEMWVQLNVFHRDMMAVTAAELEGDRLNRLCARIKEGVQTHTGITDGTFFRDQGWFFYQLGRLIERADQTTRLLDIRYHLLVPPAGEERRVAELTRWGGVLRAAAGHHAFRRAAGPRFTPADVVAFLLTDTSFPRSVGLCIEQIEWVLSHLRSRYRLRGTGAALERVEELRAAVFGMPVAHILDAGLHGFLDGVQRDLTMLANEIGTSFFRDWRPLLPQAAEAAAPDITRQEQSDTGMTQTMGGMTQTLAPTLTPLAHGP